MDLPVLEGAGSPPWFSSPTKIDFEVRRPHLPPSHPSARGARPRAGRCRAPAAPPRAAPLRPAPPRAAEDLATLSRRRRRRRCPGGSPNRPNASAGSAGGAVSPRRRQTPAAGPRGLLLLRAVEAPAPGRSCGPSGRARALRVGPPSSERSGAVAGLRSLVFDSARRQPAGRSRPRLLTARKPPHTSEPPAHRHAGEVQVRPVLRDLVLRLVQVRG